MQVDGHFGTYMRKKHSPTFSFTTHVRGGRLIPMSNQPITTRKNRETGTHITIIHHSDLGVDDGNGTCRWYTVCEEHNEHIGHATKALAIHHAPNPLGWCEVCMGAL